MLSSSKVFQADVRRQVTLPCLEYRPDGAVPEGGWPLVLFLHGAAEKGIDGAAVRRAVLPALLDAGLALDALVVCPQCPPGPGWPIGDVSVLFDALIARDEVDAERVHLTGVSMGARGAWEFAYHRADDLASIVPICGIGVPNLAPLVAEVPAWLFHGTADDVVPLARSEEMVTALEAAGGEVRFTPLSDQPHDCGREVYGDPQLWQWMLSQRLSSESKVAA